MSVSACSAADRAAVTKRWVPQTRLWAVALSAVFLFVAGSPTIYEDDVERQKVVQAWVNSMASSGNGAGWLSQNEARVPGPGPKNARWRGSLRLDHRALCFGSILVSSFEH